VIDDRIRKLKENAENGIRLGKAGFVLTSSKELEELGQRKEAEDILRRALQEGSWNEPSKINMLTSLCKIIIANGTKEDFEEAIELIKAYSLDDPRFSVIEANALGKLDRKPEAISLLEKRIDSDPAAKYNSGLASKLSTLYLEIGNNQEAVDFLVPIVEDGPLKDRLEMKQILADAYIKTKNEEKAISLLSGQKDPRSRKLIERANLTLARDASSSDKARIFIIHGHIDDDTLLKIKYLLTKIGAEPVTFDDLEKPGALTIIELLEKNIPLFDSIIALLTPDDEGRKRGTDTWKLRAREKVLIEAGYGLISKRRRSLLIALGDVSIPSDLEGIHSIKASTWSSDVGLKVAKRLVEMKINVDPTKAI
jgi:predicted nucleotide-binding protein